MKSRESTKLNRLGDMTIRNRVRVGELRRTKNGKLSPLYHDGGGLYLKITGPGTASWVFRYNFKKRERELGLGAYPLVSLAEARDKAGAMRKLLADGIDPGEHQAATRQQAALDKAKNVTFRHCAELWLEVKRKTCEPSTVRTYELRLHKHVYESLAKLPVKEMDSTLILQVLEPIWERIAPTANEVRIHLEEIFDLAKARTYRDRDSQNPAAWKGHLEHVLPAIGAIHATEHRKMLPYAEMREFMTTLQALRDGYPSVRARCCELMIRTTTRPNEAARARWSEFNFGDRVWNIPANKKKERRPHIVPLSDQAIAVLELQRTILAAHSLLHTTLGKKIVETIQAHPWVRNTKIAELVGCHPMSVFYAQQALRLPPRPLGEYVFERYWSSGHYDHGQYVVRKMTLRSSLPMRHLEGKQLNNVLLPSLGYGHVHAHGFRSSFGTWVGEETHYEDKLREFQLAHKVDDDTAAAYNRGTGLEKRRRMVQDWSDYCDGIITSTVIPYPKAVGSTDE